MFFLSLYTERGQEQVVSLQQNMLRHRWSAVPDYGMCSGFLPADIPTGRRPGELPEIILAPLSLPYIEPPGSLLRVLLSGVVIVPSTVLLVLCLLRVAI